MVSLRQFPANPPSGEIGGVEWLQSMSRITLSYQLEEAGITQDDVEVKITGFQVDVAVKGTKVKALTGDLYELVRPPPSSWWVLAGGDGASPPTLVLQLVKEEHGAWPEAFFSGAAHPYKKGRYSWTPIGKEEDQIKNIKIRLNEYEIVPPGRPEQDDTAWYPPTHFDWFSPISSTYLCSPDDLVVGTSVKQDDKKIYLTVHFDNDALAYFDSQRPFEDLFGADLTSNSVYVFIRGDDQNPIINATFTGEISPSACTWRKGTDDAFRNRQKTVGLSTPVLALTLEKGDGYRYTWPRVFDSCWQHRLMVKNQDEYEEMVAASAALEWTDDNTDPEVKASLQEKAAMLDSFVEERYDGIPDAATFRRNGYDISSPDYWANVYDHVKQKVYNEGYVSAPKALEVE